MRILRRLWSRLVHRPRETRSGDAVQAVRDAEIKLHAVEAHGAEVAELVSSLKHQRQVNHFRERIVASMKG